MHPKCFEMFKKLSTARFGKIDIDGLWMLREVSKTPSLTLLIAADKSRTKETSRTALKISHDLQILGLFSNNGKEFRIMYLQLAD